MVRYAMSDEKKKKNEHEVPTISDKILWDSGVPVVTGSWELGLFWWNPWIMRLLVWRKDAETGVVEIRGYFPGALCQDHGLEGKHVNGWCEGDFGSAVYWLQGIDVKEIVN